MEIFNDYLDFGYDKTETSETIGLFQNSMCIYYNQFISWTSTMDELVIKVIDFV